MKASISKKLLYLLLAAVSVPLGLATRKYGTLLPSILAQYGGDVLYAAFLFFCFRFLLVRRSLTTVALLTYLFCVSIEVLQLWKAPWLLRIRENRLGGLILGFEFLWSDIVCYFLGTLSGFAVAWMIERRRDQESFN